MNIKIYNETKEVNDLDSEIEFDLPVLDLTKVGGIPTGIKKTIYLNSNLFNGTKFKGTVKEALEKYPGIISII